jgi:SecD/SecF fusion protein
MKELLPILLFLYGLSCMALLGWYVATDLERRKRILGTILLVMVTALCVQQFMPLSKIPLGIDLKGGTSFLLELTPRDPSEPITTQVVNEAVSQIRKRVDGLGGKESLIAPTAENRILVQVPELEESGKISSTREQLEKVSRLEFRMVDPQGYMKIPGIEAGTELKEPGYSVHDYTYTDDKGKEQVQKLLIKDRPELTGDTVKDAFVTYGVKGYEIAIEFNQKGSQEFARITTENVGNLFAIMLDNKVSSAPRINEPITGGRCSISGSFTEEEARSLASTLENPLQVKPRIVSQTTVTATLGQDAIKSGIFAGLAGLIGTLLFMILYYRGPGVVAVIGLLVNTAMVLGGMAMFGFVMTLPGIAGVILAIGVAVDANVLIFERLREETALGKPVKPALDSAFNKALSAILDSNLTTLITTGILFYLATGPVKGFAVTLTIGVIASLFAALVCGRALLSWMIHLGWWKKVSMADLFGKTSFDFLKWRKVSLVASLVVLLGCAGYGSLKWEHALGTDFRGGDTLRIETGGKLTTEQLRAVAESVGQGEASIQTEKDPSTGKEYKRIVSDFETSDKIKDALTKAHPELDLTNVEAERMGPVVGGELARSSALALALGLLGILIYVWLRFELSFAVAAIVAVVHDVVITLGILIVCGGELNLTVVGAILTVAGYSINDTIVIFDRIREHLKAGRKQSIKDLMNESLNETLQRTVLTGSTTLVPLLVLFFFGGDVLKDFSFTLLVGILVGTYSSVFIASPIVLWWSRLTGKDLREEVLSQEEAAKPKPAPLAAS